MHLGPFGCLTKLSSKRAKLVQKFVPRNLVGILATNTPDPAHWTLKSCFGVFRSVCVHLVSFRNFKKRGAKRGEMVQLLQKFVPRIHVVIFATNTSDPPHLTINSFFGVLYSVWVHLGSFRNCMKLGVKRGELVQLMQKFVPRSHVVIFRNEHT